MARGAAEAGADPQDGPEPGRVRRPGAGRPKAEDAQGGLRQALLGLVDAGTRGDPVAEVRWTVLSLRDLERELAARGFRCRKDAVARILKADGYSLRGMAKVLEGKEQHPDRDEQFRRINAAIAEFTAAGDPWSAWTRPAAAGALGHQGAKAGSVRTASCEMRAPRGQRAASGWNVLTPNELMIATLVARGDSTADIAGGMFLSRRTVQSYISRILAKLGAKTG